jgi:hypothetical protein
MIPALQTARIIWAALLTSTVIFFVALLVTRPPIESPPEPSMLPILGVVAAVVAVVSFVLPAHLSRQALAAAKIETREETVADPSRADSDVLPYREAPTVTRRVPVDPGVAVRRALALHQTPLILGLALSESIALFGVVLGLVGFELPLVVPFFVLSWISIAARYPTLERAVRPLEQAQGLHIPRP